MEEKTNEYLERRIEILERFVLTLAKTVSTQSTPDLPIRLALELMQESRCELEKTG